MKVNVVHSGNFKLDGGAMFGVVPKRVWTRYNTVDENNMCTWALRCLLIQTAERKILVDTGIGNKQDKKFMSFFEPHGEHSLLKSLKNLSVSPEEITDVFLTHLHFDHVGGALSADENGDHYLTFPNAVYWSCKPHFQWASNPNPREKASFLPENFLPLKEQGVLQFVEPGKNVRFSDEIHLEFVYGHTEAMMLPIIQINERQTLAYCADLIPSHGHVGLPYVMSYDVRPLVTMEEKQVFLEEAVDKNYILFFEHDKDHECCLLKKTNSGRIEVDRLLSLKDALSFTSE